MCHGAPGTAVHYARGSFSTVVSQVRVFFIFFSQIKLCFPKKELEADRQKSTTSCQSMEKSGVGEMVVIFKDMRTGMTILSLLYY